VLFVRLADRRRGQSWRTVGHMNATIDTPNPARLDELTLFADRDWCTDVPVVDPSRLLDYYEHFASVRVLRHHLEP